MNPLPPPLIKITPSLPPPPKTGGYTKKSPEWQSMGLRQKPTTCSMCAYSQVGTAFVPDYVPSTARLAFVFAHPRKDDVADQKPLSGPWGEVVRKLLIEDLGRGSEEVTIVHTVRCMPRKIATRNGPAYQYPTGHLQRAAEGNCRMYDNSAFRDGLLKDGGLIDWNPTLFLTTLDISTILEVGAFKFLIQQDVKKAWKFADEGERPAVLFGSEVLSLVAGHLTGGAKRWRGSWWSGSWAFEARVRKEGFR